MPVCRVLCHTFASHTVLLALLVILLTSGCMSPEQRMVLKVEGLIEQQKFDGALSYLERYLGRYGKSLAAWRFRVLIRLEQEQRATAAAEYAALSKALDRHEPKVLREVVLGAGGRWLLSDYSMLARCGSENLVNPSFFKELLNAQHLGKGSMSKVAVSNDEIAAVLDALPGSLNAAETWPLVEAQGKVTNASIRSRLVSAAGRHLEANGLEQKAQEVALTWISEAASDSDPRLREASLHAALLLPAGPGRESVLAGIVDALSAAGDSQRAASMFLLGAGGKEAWSTEQLGRWAAATSEPIATFAIAQLQHRTPKRKQALALTSAAKSKNTGQLLAAATGPEGKPEAAWSRLHVEERRLWAAAMARSKASDHAAWTALTLSDSDAPVVQAAAEGIAITLPGTEGAEALVTPLRTALRSQSASSRAAAARAAIVRDLKSLAPDLEKLAQHSDERVMVSVLDALVETGASGWDSFVGIGLSSSLDLVREKAVDAAAASCNKKQQDLLTSLLLDSDPHVAVRAASVLYLGIGDATKRSSQ